MTHAGPTSVLGSMEPMSLPSLPVTQWIGASTWVPTCSPIVSVYHAHAGPRAADLELSSRDSPGVLAKGGGSWMTGVVSDSGWVRSTISTAPEASPSSSADTWLAWVLDMMFLLVRGLAGPERLREPFCTDGGVDLGVKH